MIKKEIVFYLPEKYSFDKWVSLNKKIESICRGYGIASRSVKEKKNRWIETLQKDFYISEAVNILEDLNINLENYPVAQLKK